MQLQSGKAAKTAKKKLALGAAKPHAPQAILQPQQ